MVATGYMPIHVAAFTAATLVALFMLLTAVLIAKEAVTDLVTGNYLKPQMPALIASIEGFANFVVMVDREKGAKLQGQVRGIIERYAAENGYVIASDGWYIEDGLSGGEAGAPAISADAGR